jgi:hypothetical protein
VLSPGVVEYSLNLAATQNAYGVGALLIIFNLISAARLLDQGQELFNIVVGIWLLSSPYVLGFESAKGPAINALMAGAMVVVLAGWQLHDAVKAGKK